MFESAENTHDNAGNQEINLKKKGKRDLPASKDKNLAKIWKENDKKFGWWSLEPTRRERKEKNYLKRTLKNSKSDLF